jgi:signal transduction histidine kinase
MRDVIQTQAKVHTELYAEALDMHRFPRERLEQDLVALMRKKYQDLDVDVVVAMAPIALNFAQRYRDEIWPGAAIVFNSVPPSHLKESRLSADTVGVPVQLDYRQTLDLALTLHPETRRIVVVTGDAETDYRHLSYARPALDSIAARVDIQYIVGLSLDETLAAISTLPPDSVVLYLTMFRDGAGIPHVPRDILQQIAEASPVTVFGVFESYLGHGIAAGSITTYSEQGRRTGELVSRVLNGEAPSAIGILPPGRSGCVADWQQLQRWGIDEKSLPADCEIRFRTVTFWDQYRWYILTALAIFLAQATTIVALTISLRRLKRSQLTLAQENDRRLQVEAVAEELRGRLTRFSKEVSLGTMATAIAHEINQPLIAIQNYAQAAKRRIQGNIDDRRKLIELFAKIEGQAERAGTITQRVRSLTGRSDVNLQPVSLCPLIDGAIHMMESDIESRACEIRCKSDGARPVISGDGLQIQLVLVNLLQNAMKSVCSGGGLNRRIDVDVRAVDEKQVRVSVTDRGTGIAPEVAANIFEPFVSRTRGGVGMGLAVSKAIIEAHGGDLWFEPNPAGGAVFHFTLGIADA